MVRSINEAIKFGSIMIVLLTFLLALLTFTFKIGDSTRTMEKIVILMVIFSFISALATWFKKNFR